MEVLINHCFCQDSNWGGFYHCSVIVSIEQYANEKDVWSNKTNKDWDNVVEEADFFNHKMFEKIKEKLPIERAKSVCEETTIRLKPEVEKWLNKNVKDRKDKKQVKGWSIGSDARNARETTSFHIYFHRQTDAIQFIKKWSQHQKPLTWFNYFKEIRKQLDIKSNKMKVVKEFSNS